MAPPRHSHTAAAGAVSIGAERSSWVTVSFVMVPLFCLSSFVLAIIPFWLPEDSRLFMEWWFYSSWCILVTINTLLVDREFSRTPLYDLCLHLILSRCSGWQWWNHVWVEMIDSIWIWAQQKTLSAHHWSVVLLVWLGTACNFCKLWHVLFKNISSSWALLNVDSCTKPFEKNQNIMCFLSNIKGFLISQRTIGNVYFGNHWLMGSRLST